MDKDIKRVILSDGQVKTEFKDGRVVVEKKTEMLKNKHDMYTLRLIKADANTDYTDPELADKVDWTTHPNYDDLSGYLTWKVYTGRYGNIQHLYNPDPRGHGLVDPGVFGYRYNQFGKLHCDNGPALEFFHPKSKSDNLFFINGLAIQEEDQAGLDRAKQIVMAPETLTVEDIAKIRNEEIRRIAIERMGLDKYLSELNGEILDEGEKSY